MLLGCQALVKCLQNMIKARDLPGSPAVKNLPWKCLVVVSLRLLFLVPTGVPVRSGDATFPKAMDNVTVRQGESATLR